MVKQYQRQDQFGNVIYNHTSSDIVFDLNTGRTVKQDIDTIMAALGIAESSGGSAPVVNINASSLSGKTIDELVLKETYTNAINSINTELGMKAPLVSPSFTGEPTVPTPSANDNTQKIANTAYVDSAISDALLQVTNTLKNYAASVHKHAASDITAGTFADTNVMAKNGSDYTVSRIRNISFIGADEELPATLANGTLLAVYEG